jgi:hypothetical protein
MAYVITRQGDTTQAVFGGRPLLMGSVVEIAMQAADYVAAVGIPLSAAQAGLSQIFHAFGYFKSSAGVARGVVCVWDASLSAFIIFGSNGAAVARLLAGADGSALITNGDILVVLAIGPG